jgi:hypothetical protein
MPRTLVNTKIYEKDGVNVWIMETVYPYIDQLISVYELDMSDATSQEVKDVLKLQEIVAYGFDWESELKKLPRKKDGSFHRFRIVPLFEAKSFETVIPKGVKKILPVLFMHAFSGNEVLVSLYWLKENEKVLNVKGFEYYDLVK